MERNLDRIKALRVLPALAVACHAEAMERALDRIANHFLTGDEARELAVETIAYRAKIHEGL